MACFGEKCNYLYLWRSGSCAGSTKSLADARSLGGKIQMVYSPMDAFEYAKEHKDEQVVFLSVGFETTTPASCLSVKMAKEAGLTNYALLTANKTMPVPMRC